MGKASMVDGMFLLNPLRFVAIPVLTSVAAKPSTSSNWVAELLLVGISCEKNLSPGASAACPGSPKVKFGFSGSNFEARWMTGSGLSGDTARPISKATLRLENIFGVEVSRRGGTRGGVTVSPHPPGPPCIPPCPCRVAGSSWKGRVSL